LTGGFRLPTSLLLRRLHRVPLVNFLHDAFRPPHRVGDGAHRGGNPRSAVVLRQFAGRQNRGGDQQHALSTFVHQSSLALSLFVRYKLSRVDVGAPRARCATCEPDARRPFQLVTKVKNKGRNTTANPKLVPAAKSPQNQIQGGTASARLCRFCANQPQQFHTKLHNLKLRSWTNSLIPQ